MPKWRENKGEKSIAEVPSTREGGVPVSQVPPLKLFGGDSPGAYSELPDGS